MTRTSRRVLQAMITLALACHCTVKAECLTAPQELGPSVILSNQAVLMNDFPEGTVLSLECDNGHDPHEGSNTTTCQNGIWTSVELRCKRKNCGPPKVIPYLTFRYPNGTNGTNATYFKDRLTAVCARGFQLVGSSYWQCLNYGWKGKSSCENITCDASLPVIENGRVVKAPRDNETILFGTSFQYICNQGFHLTGNDTITCTEKGYTDPPKCEGLQHSTETPATDLPGPLNFGLQHSTETPATDLPGPLNFGLQRSTETPATDLPGPLNFGPQDSAETPEKDQSGSVISGIISGLVAFLLIFGLIYYWSTRNKGSYDTQEQQMGIGPDRGKSGAGQGHVAVV